MYLLLFAANTPFLHVVLREQLVELLKEEEGQDGVGTDTQKVWRKALPQGENTLVLNQFHKAVEGARVLASSIPHSLPSRSLHHLQPRLDDVHRQRHEAAEQARRQRRGDVQTQAVRLEQVPLLVVQLLRLRGAAQLGRVQHHRADDGGGGSLPQRLHALLLADAVHRLEAVRVAAALLGRQTVVSGSADQRDFRRVAHYSATSASDHAANQLLGEGNVVAIVSLAAPVHAVREDAQTGRSVRDLTQHTRGIASHEVIVGFSPSIQLEKTLALCDLHQCIQTAFVLLLRSPLTTTHQPHSPAKPQLHACFHKIHGLNTRCRQYTGRTAQHIIRLWHYGR